MIFAILWPIVASSGLFVVLLPITLGVFAAILGALGLHRASQLGGAGTTMAWVGIGGGVLAAFIGLAIFGLIASTHGLAITNFDHRQLALMRFENQGRTAVAMTA